MSFIKIKNLKKIYPEFQLGEINIDIQDGDIIGLIGINGSGKTTLIKSILNLVKIDNGNIEIFDKKLNRKNEIAIKDELGIVLDSAYFYKKITVKDSGNIFGAIYSTWDKELFNKYCEEFNISQTKCVDQLSKGMSMKLSVAIALSKKCKGLIMDEPTAGLDPLVRKNILLRIKKYIDENNCSMIFSTHITSDIEMIANKIILLDKGKIKFYGGLDEFKNLLGNNATIEDVMLEMIEDKYE